MVGLVIVSHSAALAGGVVELARQMGGEQVRIEAAGGLALGENAYETARAVDIPLGLHARPAALFVETVGRFDATVSVIDERSSRGPADARSLSALVMLDVRHGHALRVRADGPDA